MTRFLCFSVSFLSPVGFDLVGRITLGECLVPILFLINWKSSFAALSESKLARTVLWFGMAYFTSLVISDLYRESVPRDFLRGWAKVALTLFAYLTFVGLARRHDLVLTFLWGTLAAIVVAMAVAGGAPPLSAETYKWTYGTPMTLSAFLAAGYLARRWNVGAMVFPATAGAVSFLMNFRSLAGMTLLATFVVTAKSLTIFRQMTGTRALALTIVGLVAGTAIFSFYVWAAPQGILGESARMKFAMQTEESGDRNFSLLSGRGEILFATPKIVESPLLGWGSWAKDAEFVQLRHKELHGDKYLGGVAGELGVIPTHSHIVGGWIEAGILGAVFWFAVLWLIARNLLYGTPIVLGHVLSILLIYSGIELCWHIIFSPFGAGRRVETGFFIAWHVAVANELGFVGLTSLIPNRMTHAVSTRQPQASGYSNSLGSELES